MIRQSLPPFTPGLLRNKPDDFLKSELFLLRFSKFLKILRRFLCLIFQQPLFSGFWEGNH